ncbi:MAG: NFACT RNA binding domain-containing protein [Bacillota bacterium]|nr:NFACT RNA binding domain-containing protein [Bacillota bacterium]
MDGAQPFHEEGGRLRRRLPRQFDPRLEPCLGLLARLALHPPTSGPYGIFPRERGREGGRLPDGILLRALAEELTAALAGARLEKIVAPGERTFRLRFRAAAGGTRWLEISLDPEADRILLDPPAAPGAAGEGEGAGFWLAQLRRHLAGARLEEASQPGWERLLRLRFLGRNALGDPARYELVAELMGARSNLLLLEAGGRVVDALRRASPDENPARPVLPGLAYLPPPPPREPRWRPEEGPAALGARLASAAGRGRTPARALAATVAGMGPAHALLALEAAGLGEAESLPAGGEALARLARRVAEMLEAAAAGRWQPAVLEGPGEAEAVAVLPPDLPRGRLALRPASSPSAAVAAAMGRRLGRLQLERRRRALAAPVRSELERLRRRLETQRRELAEVEGVEEWRREGELLLAHASAFRPGQRRLEVPDYFDPGLRPRRLELEAGETPVRRAQRLFRAYRKALRRRELLEPAVEEGERRAHYLESVLLELEQAASLAELAEVEAEMEAEGLLPASREAGARGGRGGRAGRRPPAEGGRPAAGPLRLLSRDGWEIWLGRNNRQNDELTMRLARPRDLWFHARGVPGAHVLLPVRGREEPPERARLEAAALAALHSRARAAAQVEVDWTERQNVWKPRGAPPGFVLYRNERTLAVRPDPALEAELLARTASAAPGAGTTGGAAE